MYILKIFEIILFQVVFFCHPYTFYNKPVLFFYSKGLAKILIELSVNLGTIDFLTIKFPVLQHGISLLLVDHLKYISAIICSCEYRSLGHLLDLFLFILCFILLMVFLFLFFNSLLLGYRITIYFRIMVFIYHCLIKFTYYF